VARVDKSREEKEWYPPGLTVSCCGEMISRWHPWFTCWLCGADHRRGGPPVAVSGRYLAVNPISTSCSGAGRAERGLSGHLCPRMAPVLPVR
jgi:hypothetical protein